MLLRKTLLVCLPVLALAACGHSKKDNKNPTSADATTYGKNETTPPTTTPETPTTPDVPVVPTPDNGKGGETTNQNQNQNQNQNETPVTHECETLVIDFEKGSNGAGLHFGEEMKDQYASWGVSFLAHKNLSNGQTISNVQPVLVDTPLTGLAATTDVADRAKGGYVKLFFAKPTAIVSLDLINVENNSSNIELFNLNDKNEYVTKSVQAIAQHGNKETFNLSVDDHSYIRKIAIKFSGSSAVDNIKICVKN